MSLSLSICIFFFNDTATTDIYTYCHTFSLPAALPIYLLIGYVGLLSFGHAMFFGAAAYIAAHTVKVWGWTPELGILAGTLCAALLGFVAGLLAIRSEEHTSELQSLMRLSYAVFCLKKIITLCL